MSKYRVVVTDHAFGDLDIERSILDDIATVDASNTVDDPSERAENLSAADAVLNFRKPLGAEEIRAMTDCRIIARYGIGYDNVDLDAATRSGIPVTNVPEYCIEEVPTHTLAFSLGLIRGIKPYDRSIREGDWDRTRGPEIHRLSTMTVGIVGCGSIGRRVADRFLAFGAEVIVSDPYLTESELPADVALVPFESLIERANLLTVHSPLTDSTRGLLSREEFERLPDDAYLINVARGAIVDTAALRWALNAGELAGAALDVFPEEPPDVYEPLREHPSVITTPHVAWYSEEANEERRRTASENVRRVLEDNPPENVVNDVEIE